MTVVTKKYPAGFQLLTKLIGGLKTHKVKASVTIAKGDWLQDDGSGFAQLGTAFDTTSLGMAIADVDNSTGSDGSETVQIVPPHSQHQFIVPVENALITQDAVGSIVDLESEDGIDLSDTASVNGFKIDDFDVSADAITANTFGYAIGHIEAVS